MMGDTNAHNVRSASQCHALHFLAHHYTARARSRFRHRERRKDDSTPPGKMFGLSLNFPLSLHPHPPPRPGLSCPVTRPTRRLSFKTVFAVYLDPSSDDLDDVQPAATHTPQPVLYTHSVLAFRCD
ncbi:hypothetical protein O3P69_013344 [Scylla paramamosain]|uniref:Uncharacterized protein n=1 Tax=Scylla paramamosain TaxID=85552 RepID=A0AAW0U0P1_SCYPA